MAQKNNPIPIAMQASSIKRMFPNSTVTSFHGQKITWTHTITPSPLGAEYEIKLVFEMHKYPQVFVLNPKPLALAKGEKRLPHCYDQIKQRLCLFYPGSSEWSKYMLLTDTVIPWAYEWLYHYEIWLGTGEWKGGGIHPQNNQPKI